MELIAAWTASGRIGFARTDVPSIAAAVQKLLEDAAARQLQPASVAKLRNLLEKRLVAWCEEKGLRHLKQLDVDMLRSPA